ncbi:type 1 glutamine amidotransferase [Halobacteriovorax sp.]|uniref:type 1 glutamine amidotransferase n=1 Tax=Halobacteriovorax sp. TaxID=2020862 RepID=UPI003AF30665
MKSPIAIIDCSIENPSYNCMNQIIQNFNRPFTYHWVSKFGCESLDKIEEASGYIIFGSDSNVYQRLKWQIDLAKRMKSKMENGIPVLGICFGHQLIADIFGAQVDMVTPDNKLFEGTRELEILEDQFGFVKGEKFELFITHHYEVKELPENFVHLAQSKDCFYDGIAHKDLPFFSFQGHPEASQDFINHHIEQELSAEKLKAGFDGGHKVFKNFIEYIDKL